MDALTGSESWLVQRRRTFRRRRRRGLVKAGGAACAAGEEPNRRVEAHSEFDEECQIRQSRFWGRRRGITFSSLCMLSSVVEQAMQRGDRVQMSLAGRGIPRLDSPPLHSLYDIRMYGSCIAGGCCQWCTLLDVHLPSIRFCA